jgi:protease I
MDDFVMRRMEMELDGKHIAILAEDHYEDLELWYPLIRMREAGADVNVVGMPGVESYKSKHDYPVPVDVAATEMSAGKVDAVIVPGGYAPDRIRRHRAMLDLVRSAFDQGKVVAMICHAGWVPISAGIVEGKRVTSVSAIKDDLVNAGAVWVDAEVVRDGNLISSRHPGDLPAFCREIIRALKE